MNDIQSFIEDHFERIQVMNKKEKIIDAAVSVFKEKGIEKTKISDIVKQAGIAQGTYYLYFPSKLSVMPAIAEVMVEKTIDKVRKSVQKDASFIMQLEQLVEAVFVVTEEYHEVIALVYAGLASTEHIKQWETIYEPFYSWVRTFLIEAQTAGDIRKEYNVEHTSKLVISLIESAAEQVYLYDSTQAEQVKRQKKEVLQFLIFALGVNQTI